jgi:hypothetical protein
VLAQGAVVLLISDGQILGRPMRGVTADAMQRLTRHMRTWPALILRPACRWSFTRWDDKRRVDSPLPGNGAQGLTSKTKPVFLCDFHPYNILW